MRYLLLLALIGIVSTVSACVTYNPATDTYTVDQSGSVKR